METSIAISVRDQFSPGVNSMINTTQRFNKDVEETENRVMALQRKHEALGDTLSKSQTRFDAASKALREARKEFGGLSDEASRINLEKAHEEFNKAKDEVKGWGDAIKDTQKQLSGLYDDMKRQRSGASDMLSMSSSSTLSALSRAGIGKMLGDSMAGAVNAGIGSAFGDSMGNAISTTLSGAFTGAAMGSIAGVPGMIAGGVAGLVSGGISAATGYFEKEDDYFKSMRNDFVENSMANHQSALASGKDVAKGREKMGVQLRHTFGSDEDAQEYLDNTISLANQTPFYYTDLIGVGSAYKAFGYANEELYEEQSRIADAAAIRGWDASDMTEVAKNLGYMRQSGKMSAQQVKSLQMRGLNIPKYLAIASSDENHELSDDEILRLLNASDEELLEAGITVSEEDILAMLSDIDGKKAIPEISRLMAIEFAGGAAKLAETYFGLESTLGGIQEQIQSALGDGFKEVRMDGIADQIAWDTDSMDELEESNRMMGRWEAELENERDRIYRETMDELFTSSEYQKAKAEDDAQEIYRLRHEAEIRASMEYNNSDGALAYQQMQEDLYKSTTDALSNNTEIIDAYMRLGDAHAEGYMAGYRRTLEDGIPGIFDPDTSVAALAMDRSALSTPGNAWGIPYVPYNDYYTRLHEGEAVLTAQENRSMRSVFASQQPLRLDRLELPEYTPFSPQPAMLQAIQAAAAQSAAAVGGITVNVSGNEFVVREEADIDRIARALATELQKAQQVS